MPSPSVGNAAASRFLLFCHTLIVSDNKLLDKKIKRDIIKLMSKEQTTPFIPVELQPQWDGHAREVHSQWQAKSAEDLLASMPEPQVVDLSDGTQARCWVMEPDGDYDERSVLAQSLPHAQGLKPTMFSRTKLAQDLLDKPRLSVVFPNSTKKEPAYTLTAEQQVRVANGDVSPVIEKRLRVLEKLGFATGLLAITGFSDGGQKAAAMAAKASEHYEVEAVGVFEPPNVMERSAKELRKAFTDGGLKPLQKAVRDSAIPAHSDLFFRKYRGILWPAHYLGEFASFGLAQGIPENKANQQSFCHDNLSEDLLDIRVNQVAARLLLANMRDGKIAPTDQMKRIQAESVPWMAGSSPDLVTVSGYGHEGGDNILVHGLLVRLALQAASRQ